MKHELSKERLEEIHKLASKSQKYIYHLRADEVEAMARALLAAREQEPDYYVVLDNNIPYDVFKNEDEANFYAADASGLFLVQKVFTHAAPSIPTVSFYRDGIAAAAAWVDTQREAYDNEHGHHDPDTGTFEFGNDAQLEYSSTLAEIAEGIRALHPNATSAPSIPAAVPEEPRISSEELDDETLDELIEFRRSTFEYHQAQGNKVRTILHGVVLTAMIELKECRAAMLQLEPQNAPQNIPAGYVLVPIEPTEDMVIHGFESEPSEGFSETDVWEAYEAMSGCQQAAHRAELCWAAMIAAAPKGVNLNSD